MYLWNLIARQPIINFLIVLSQYLFGNFGLAIIALTLLVNVALLKLTLKQMRASKAMQDLQPQLAQLQKKYAKDKQKMGQEQMRMYRESGMSPLGCVVPMLVQIPIWIALYQSIIRLLGVTPEDFLSLSQFLYSWPIVHSALPLSSKFLWLDLSVPDKTFVLAILVGGTMWLQQRMITQSTDTKQQQQARMMQWMMPIMFGWITLLLPSGLGLFWVTSSVIRILAQYLVSSQRDSVSARAAGQIGGDKKYKGRITQEEKRRPK